MLFGTLLAVPLITSDCLVIGMFDEGRENEKDRGMREGYLQVEFGFAAAQMEINKNLGAS